MTYTITLDMMMDTLRQGVQNVAKRSKRPDAQARYQECLDAIDVAHELYRENRIPDAKHATWAANQLFKDAGKASRS
ncbi:MAG: hypothetical protein JO142_19760 [Burkholderiales bacterium]|nr:hypothetical protein [Burkholderiales bacterium]